MNRETSPIINEHDFHKLIKGFNLFGIASYKNYEIISKKLSDDGVIKCKQRNSRILYKQIDQSKSMRQNNMQFFVIEVLFL